MKIIIEGPDATGKTTLAQFLMRKLGPKAEYHHQGLYDSDPLMETITAVESVGNAPAVFDRLHIGEQVYGPIYRGVDSLGAPGRRMLERYLLARQCVLVICTPPEGAAYDVFDKRRDTEMFGKDSDWQYLQQHAGFHGAKSELPQTRYSFVTQGSPEGMQRLWEELVHLCPPPNYGNNGVGMPTKGRVLIVGDRPSPSMARWSFPFVSSHRSGSSWWLARQLEDEGVPEQELYWVNGYTRDGRPVDGSWIERAEPREVIALGQEAANWLTPWVPSFWATRHPSYWKRFHPYEQYPLLEIIEEVL